MPGDRSRRPGLPMHYNFSNVFKHNHLWCDVAARPETGERVARYRVSPERQPCDLVVRSGVASPAPPRT